MKNVLPVLALGACLDAVPDSPTTETPDDGVPSNDFSDVEEPADDPGYPGDPDEEPRDYERHLSASECEQLHEELEAIRYDFRIDVIGEIGGDWREEFGLQLDFHSYNFMPDDLYLYSCARRLAISDDGAGELTWQDTELHYHETDISTGEWMQYPLVKLRARQVPHPDVEESYVNFGIIIEDVVTGERAWMGSCDGCIEGWDCRLMAGEEPECTD